MQISAALKSAQAKAAYRIVPLLTIGYFFASLDRVNVGFAALQMNKDIGISSEVFGFGAGLFFIAYCIFAVPANVIMERVDPRYWIGGVMIAWGTVAACMAFAQGPVSFSILRFLVGVAEAGYFPAVILYFTRWFAPNVRARMVAILMLALPLSSVLGSPISGALLLTDGFLGMRGWHWLFIIEAVPAVILGFIAFAILPKDVASARFLDENEKTAIAESLHTDTATAEKPKFSWKYLLNPTVIALTLVYIGGTSVTNALSLWQPQIIAAYNLSPLVVGFLNAVPFALGSIAMYFWSSRSDKKAERRWHTAIPLAVVFLGLLATAFVTGLAPMIAVLCIIVAAASMIKGPFWGMATERLPKSLSAQGIGTINALNNLGVFAATWVIGVVNTQTGSYEFAMLPIAALALIATILAVTIGKRTARKTVEKAPTHV
ncbi:MFS transporter [Paenarthrobacter nicotinovorans]|uniref:MFS transporter n=1 Tax=Paenarthrobacter nicotinovorans TaxID=29320 RepID=UPI0038108C60